MNKKFTIIYLTEQQVTIKTTLYAIINGVEYQVGEQSTKCYINGTVKKNYGTREDLKNEVDEKTYNTVMAMWGDTPTVTE